jgi:hypothetical protein
MIKLTSLFFLGWFVLVSPAQSQNSEKNAIHKPLISKRFCHKLEFIMSRDPYSSNSIEMLAVESNDDLGSGNVYQNLDVDHDHKNDDVSSSCSYSSVPADGCLLVYKLTSNGQRIVHKFPAQTRFFLAQYEQKLLVISKNEISKKVSKKRQIQQITPTGLKTICK